MAAHKSMLETAVELLKRKRNPQKFNKIFKEVSETLGLTDEEKESSKARFYNDLSLSALFIYTGNDEWDLKERQPIELWDKDASYFIDPEELKALKAERQKEKLALKKAEEAKLEALSLEKKKSEKIIDNSNEELLEEEQDKKVDEVTIAPSKEKKEETSDEDNDNQMMDEKDYNKYMDDYEDLYEEK
ncbi:DNA-directed RNA polymerase subunit delta [Mycoplasmatota bacterium WC44]